MKYTESESTWIVTQRRRTVLRRDETRYLLDMYLRCSKDSDHPNLDVRHVFLAIQPRNNFLPFTQHPSHQWPVHSLNPHILLPQRVFRCLIPSVPTHFLLSPPLINLQRSHLALFGPSQRPEGLTRSSSSPRSPSSHSSRAPQSRPHLSAHGA